VGRNFSEIFLKSGSSLLIEVALKCLNQLTTFFKAPLQWQTGNSIMSRYRYYRIQTKDREM